MLQEKNKMLTNFLRWFLLLKKIVNRMNNVKMNNIKRRWEVSKFMCRV